MKNKVKITMDDNSESWWLLGMIFWVYTEKSTLNTNLLKEMGQKLGKQSFFEELN